MLILLFEISALGVIKMIVPQVARRGSEVRYFRGPAEEVGIVWFR